MGRRPSRDGVEGVMLFGAWIAPFNYLLGLPVGGLFLRPLHMWAVAALLVLLASGRDRLSEGVDWPVLAFWTMVAFVGLSTAFGTPAEYKFRGMADVGLLSLNVLAFSVLRLHYGARPEGWVRFFTHLGASSVVVSVGLTVRAVSAANAGDVPGVDSYALGLGTVAGSYTAAFAAASAGFIVFSTSRRQTIAGSVAFVIHGNTMVLALARGPWLAFGIAIISTIPLAAWRFGNTFHVGRTVRRGIAVLLGLPLFFRIAISVNPFIRGLLVQRVVEVVNLEAGTGFSRLVMWRAFLEDVWRNPLFGRGAAAYREISEGLGVQGSVSENFGIEILHAGGLVAVAFLVVGFLGAAYNCLLRPGTQRVPAYTAACLTGATALVLASMTNPAAWNGLFWILLGLAATRPVAATSAESVAG